MYTIRWSENYSVGNVTIDEQHKQLFSLLEKIQDFQKSDIPVVLTELEEYAQYHFSYEEQYQREIGFDQCEAHKEEHLHFSTKIEELHKRHEEGILTMDILFATLSEWLLNHILTVDMKMKSFN